MWQFYLNFKKYLQYKSELLVLNSDLETQAGAHTTYNSSTWHTFGRPSLQVSSEDNTSHLASFGK